MANRSGRMEGPSPWDHASFRMSVKIGADGYHDELFQALIATAVDGIMVIDDRGAVEVYNRACERLFEYSPEEVLGRNVKMLMPEPYRGQHDAYLERYETTGERRVIGIGREVVGLRKDGTTFPMYLSVGEGCVSGRRIFVGIIHDLTDRRAAELRFRDLQVEMSHVSRLSAMGQLSSAMAHELNQPLAATTNYLSTARKFLEGTSDPMAQKADQVVAKAVEQVHRTGQIIRRLRDFVEKRKVSRGPEDMNAVVQDAIALSLIVSKDIDVRLLEHLTPGLPSLLMDRVQIQQVLVNLIRNAVEALRNSPVKEIDIATSLGEGWIDVAVADTGPGIPEAIAGRLFQPFVTTKSTGMGIGLMVCRSIVEAHEGTLVMTARPEGGTVFRMRLPVSVEQAGG